MRKWHLFLVLCIGMNICYSQRDFSEVIEVDSANINVLNFRLIDSTFHIFSIFPIVSSNISSSSVNLFDIYDFENSVLKMDTFSISRNMPLLVLDNKYLYGKNRSLEKGLEIRVVNKKYEELVSLIVPTKANYNLPSKPKVISSNLYLPAYIEEGEQEYSVISKVDTSLNVVWTKYFNEQYAYSYLFGIDKSIDDNILATSNVYVKEERRYYNQLLKLDTSGNILWEYFNTEELEHGAVSPWFTTLSDSNIVVSYRVSRRGNDTFFNNYLHWYPYRLQWLDHNGNMLKKKYYLSERLKWFHISRVEKGREDYFYMMGSWQNAQTDNSVRNLLIKLNNQGDSLWHRTYYHPDYSLDSVGFSIRDMHEFPDGRIAVLSMISTPYDWNKIWIFMVDSEGNCLTDNCISEGDVVSMNTYEIKYEKLSLYPNPAREQIYWNERQALDEVRIFDLLGRQVLDRTLDAIHSLDVGGLPAGTYILEGKDHAGKIYRGKFVLQ